MPALVLLFGGRSEEHSISCASAKSVMKNLPKDWFAIPIGITKQGIFVHCDISSVFDISEIKDNGSRVTWSNMSIEIDFSGKRTQVSFDLVWPLLHGKFGEDGSIQGMLQSFGIPYIGSSVYASVIAMNKHYTKAVCSQHGIPVLPWYFVEKVDWIENQRVCMEEIFEKFSLPLFVKPVDSGSSFGCNPVSEKTELISAVQAAFRYGSAVMVEPISFAPEVFYSVLERNGNYKISEPVSVKHKGKKFYDYSAKYLLPVEFAIPAHSDIRDSHELIKKAFSSIGCRHYARLDFFATERGLMLNEVNTIPGLTSKSIFSSSWPSMTYPQVIEEILYSALAK